MKVEILTPSLEDQLLLIEQAGRTCYQSHKDAITKETARIFIRMIMRRGHESVIEHSIMTVRFSGVSRGMTHELVRHRLCAFSQESSRYVDERGFEMTLPPGMDHQSELKGAFGSTVIDDVVDAYLQVYNDLREAGYKPEDARQFLPIGMQNEIVVSANFREWRHIFKMRTTRPAHWEIRTAMTRLLEMVQKPLRPIFDDFVLAGTCPKDIPYYKQDKGSL